MAAVTNKSIWHFNVVSIQQLKTRHSLKLIMATKFHCLGNAFVFERHNFPQAWSVRETLFCLLLVDKDKAALFEVDILPCSEQGMSQKYILIKGKLCFLIKCIFKVKHVTVKRERERAKMARILDTKIPLVRLLYFWVLENVWFCCLN